MTPFLVVSGRAVRSSRSSSTAAAGGRGSHTASSSGRQENGVATAHRFGCYLCRGCGNVSLDLSHRSSNGGTIGSWSRRWNIVRSSVFGGYLGGRNCHVVHFLQIGCQLAGFGSRKRIDGWFDHDTNAANQRLLVGTHVIGFGLPAKLAAVSHLGGFSLFVLGLLGVISVFLGGFVFVGIALGIIAFLRFVFLAGSFVSNFLAPGEIAGIFCHRFGNGRILFKLPRKTVVAFVVSSWQGSIVFRLLGRYLASLTSSCGCRRRTRRVGSDRCGFTALFSENGLAV
mmetsp:Transcript_21322/g.52849  ORF Transcript_21322/g.52849 Transcript_21322/m.52849 type:complete len:284 (-) Transcript_21322:2371-3222(-)